ncbi:Tubulin polymerization-promoting protein family member 2 [Chlorella vulgaris]
MADIRSVFQAFAAFGGGRDGGAAAGLEGRAFSKIFKDAGLYCRKFTTTDADLIFTSVKAKGAKRISFDAFEQALEKVAARKGSSLPEVAAVIVAAGGPKASGTRAQACRFYDDKSNWTSTAKNGGPTNVDGQKDLRSLCDRTPADARGISKASNFSRQH